MRFVFASRRGELLPLAWQVQAEGHKVQFYTEGAAGEGIVPWERVPDLNLLRPSACDCAIVEGVGLAPLRERLHSKVPTVGPTPLTDSLMEDQETLRRIFAVYDILMPLRETFQPGSLSGPVDYLTSHRRLVSLWVGSRMYHASEEPKELLSALSLAGEEPFTLMEHPQQGVPIAAGGWFNGQDFLRPWGVQLQWWHTHPGDLGLWTPVPAGALGTLYGYDPKVVTEGVARLTRILQKADYRGPIALRGYVTATDAVWTCADCSLHAMGMFLEGVRDLGDFLFQLAQGSAKHWQVRRAWYCSASLYTAAPGSPIVNLAPGAHKHLWLEEVRQQGESLYTTADRVGCATGWGGDPYEAHRRALRPLQGVTLLGKYYRTDVGKGRAADLQSLKDWAWV